MRRLIFFLPVLLFGAVAIAFAFGLTRDPSKLPSTLIDRPLPDFALLGVSPDVPGLAAADIRGEPALVNIFASWCLPCRVEHPVLMTIAREGVPIYGLDWKEPPAAGAKWIADHGNPYRRIGNDETGRVGIDLGVSGVPETFVVDARGRVRYKHVGPISREDWNGTLKPLLAELRAGA